MSENKTNKGEKPSNSDPVIWFDGDQAIVRFQYDHIATQEDVDIWFQILARRGVTLGVFSEDTPLEELRERISVGFSVGDHRPVEVDFRVKRGEPLYIGLPLIHQEDQTVLPKVIDDLTKYKESHQDLTLPQSALIDYAQRELGRIIRLHDTSLQRRGLPEDKPPVIH